MAMFGLFRNSKAARHAKKSRQTDWRSRQAVLEPLEQRCMLSSSPLSVAGLSTTGTNAETVVAGSPLLISLPGSGAADITYTAASSNSSALAPTIYMPSSSNTVIQIAVHGTNASGMTTFAGDMDFMLFGSLTDLTAAVQFFTNLVNQSYYDSAPGDRLAADGGKMIFFRNDGSSGVLQAGSTNNTPSGGGSGSSFDDAYDPNLVYSEAGVLAMAKAGDDGNDAQFFITNAVQPQYDFRYTAIGYIVEGSAIQTDIVNTTTHSVQFGSTTMSEPVNPVIIDSISVISDTTDGVLELSAPSTSAGLSYTVTLNVMDGTAADEISYKLNVTVVASTTSNSPNEPYVQAISPIQLTSGQTASENLANSTYDPAGVTVFYAYNSSTPSNGSLSISNWSYTAGTYSLTASSAFAGVSEVYLGVENTTDKSSNGYGNFDTQVVPVLVTPTAPTLKLLSPSTSGTTGIDNSLEFQVSGLFSGLTVDLYYEGSATPIATGTATGSTLNLTTNSATTLPPGAHTFYATQTYSSSSVEVGNFQPASETLTSQPSSTLSLTVSTTAVNLTGGTQFTLRRSGAYLQLVNDTTGVALLNQTIASISAIQINGAAGAADQVTVNMLYGGAFTLPNGQVTFTAGSGSPGDLLVFQGANVADTLTLNNTSLVAGGLTIGYTNLQGITLKGGTGADNYVLNSSPASVKIIDAAGVNALNFSGDTAGKGITLNLGLNAGQAQTIAPWGKTLALTGTFQDLTATPYADVLTGGSAACIIRGDGGNDVIRAGSGNTVLVGGVGNNTLYGGSGTCVLIAGGGGTSTLDGGSGNTMLIGGSTSYDANDAALLSILNNLTAAEVHTGRTRIPVSNPTAGAYPLTMGKTVKDSGTADTLVEGTGATWFLPGAHDRVIY